MPDRLAALINSAWEDRDQLNTETRGEIREALEYVAEWPDTQQDVDGELENLWPKVDKLDNLD